MAKSFSRLLDRRLTKTHAQSAAKLLLGTEPKDPVAALIGAGLVKETDFYKNLAKVFRLPYMETIPQPIASDYAPHLLVPTELLHEYQVFLGGSIDAPRLITANPLVDPKIVKLISVYVGCKRLPLAISSHAEVRRAQQWGAYFDARVSSEDAVSVLYPTQSARTYTTALVPRIFPIATLIGLFILGVMWPVPVLTGIFVVMNTAYFVINPYKLYVFLASFHRTPGSGTVRDETARQVNPFTLPHYTVLVPLRHEAEMVSNITTSMLALDYPRHLLDIKFVVDADDTATIAAVREALTGASPADASVAGVACELVIVPQGSIATKPRAIDYALFFSRGSLLTIYDAEDRPEPDQLKKAVEGFLNAPLDTLCVQARLNYFNSRQNLLTRLFSLEYGFWFDYYLPGLEKVKAPIPLGGTSNHFITSRLRKLGSWDAFNVTEDADLGLRIYRKRLNTATIDSTTFEEANSRIASWIRQRTRWQKGFLVTFLVHSARPGELIRDLGWRRFGYSLVTFGGNFFLPFFNPILILVFILGLVHRFSTAGVWSPIVVMAGTNLVFGNAIYLFGHAASAIRDKRYDLLPATLLLPVYWLGISIASWRALGQFMVKPYYWEKTQHYATFYRFRGPGKPDRPGL